MSQVAYGRTVIVHTRLEGSRLAGNLLGDPSERDQMALEWLSSVLEGV